MCMCVCVCAGLIDVPPLSARRYAFYYPSALSAPARTVPDKGRAGAKIAQEISRFRWRKNARFVLRSISMWDASLAFNKWC